jgi:hypothetical protein
MARASMCRRWVTTTSVASTAASGRETARRRFIGSPFGANGTTRPGARHRSADRANHGHGRGGSPKTASPFG